jgi:type I restriction enzyme, S subunit
VNIRDLRRLKIGQKEIQLYALHQDDIVVNRVNSGEFLGKSAIVPALHEPIVFESNMMRIRIDRKQMHPRYCIAFLQSDFVKQQIARRAKDAVNQSSINQSDVRSFKFVLPPPCEQTTFVERAAEIEAIELAQRTHLAHLDALFASLQHRAFRGEL